MNSKFIVIGGVIKDSRSNVLKYLPRATGKNGIVITREPGGTPFAEKVSTLLWEDLATSIREIDRHLIKAMRIDHEDRVIGPALKRGDHVICDSLDYTLLADRPIPVHEPSLLHTAFDREQLAGKPTLLIVLTHKEADERLAMIFRNVASTIDAGFIPWDTEVVYVDTTDPEQAAQEIRDVIAHHLETETAVPG